MARLLGRRMNSKEATTVQISLADVDEDDDVELADEVPPNVWQAYQRWRVTKIRLDSIPDQSERPSFISSFFSSTSILGGEDTSNDQCSNKKEEQQAS
mmetsp:Transcript_3938/g.5168  ORF Transcript_3938/g.5168 Transcript_3938/m.5168 type:complete len:98 (-) Transcript_3938:71-364(-)